MGKKVAVVGELTELIKDFTKFMGRMEKFEETVTQWQKDANVRFTNIENQISQRVVESEARQEAVNVKQDARNAARGVEQAAQDVKIRDLQEEGRVIKVELSKKDIAKIIAAIAVLITASTGFIAWLMETLHP